MSKQKLYNQGRRRFLKYAGGGLALAGGASLLPGQLRRQLLPIGESLADPSVAPNLFYVGTDGWMYLPPDPPIFSAAVGGIVHPDDYAEAPFNTYIFGFRNLTGLNPAVADDMVKIQSQKNKAQHSAPLFWVDEYNSSPDNTFRVDLLNIGLAQRPDLTDSHSIHWHGFRNVIPFFDGEPTGSFAVPVGRVFRYIFKPRDPGTYMFHCHVEDTEHVQMGMTGLVFVRPRQNVLPDGTDLNGFIHHTGYKYAYNDGNGATHYDREFAMFLSEVWAEAHWADAHIQLPEWSDYHVDFGLLNGRVYPDTLAPNSPFNPGLSTNAYYNRLTSGEIVTPARPELQYQPLSALVTCNAGERVLLRFASLGFKEAAMTLAGIKMKIVGKDATPMRGFSSGYASPRNSSGADTSFETNTVLFGAGESIDAIFTAPDYIGPGPFDTYVLYNRAFDRSDNQSAGVDGQRTEIRVYPGTTVPNQTVPNHNPLVDPVV